MEFARNFMRETSILVFIDLEMTGLNVKEHRIIEFAMIVTDTELNELERYTAVIHQDDYVLSKMTAWCAEQFKGAGGLTEQSQISSITELQVENDVVAILQKYCGTKYLCGNSVYMDKYFIMEFMPNISKLLHYRIIDISTIKTLALEWINLPSITKVNKHRALDDIIESIKELKYFKFHLFNKS
eukprot:NODE_104_length_19952_cov_0.449000.p13 type:complete len:185 gc:universal NODE_104_length_19952_cov_0.449000:19005-18451(-)